MANFLIQTIDGQVRHDFSFALIEAIDYQNWLNKGSHDYVLCDIGDMFEHDFTEYIPSGTIQFIQEFLDFYYDIDDIKPINIPTELRKIEYTKRLIFLGTLDDIHKLRGKGFVKSNDIIKGFAGIVDCESADLQEGNYLASEIVDIDSEWRGFVYNRELVGLQNYLGDFTMMPDVKLIQKMIDSYKSSPPAYTIDVGVNRNMGTFIIECHNFISTGVYGFSDNRIMPQMMIQSFRHLVRNGW